MLVSRAFSLFFGLLSLLLSLFNSMHRSYMNFFFRVRIFSLFTLFNVFRLCFLFGFWWGKLFFTYSYWLFISIHIQMLIFLFLLFIAFLIIFFCFIYFWTWSWFNSNFFVFDLFLRRFRFVRFNVNFLCGWGFQECM